MNSLCSQPPALRIPNVAHTRQTKLLRRGGGGREGGITVTVTRKIHGLIQYVDIGPQFRAGPCPHSTGHSLAGQKHFTHDNVLDSLLPQAFRL